jgi:hypothetical protein
MWKGVTVAIVLISLACILALPSGCLAFKKSSGSSGSVAVSSEPLTSNWSMTRQSIDPPFPSIIPGSIVDQIIPKSTTWTISLSGSQLKIVYGGRNTWFNPMGMSVNVKNPTISEDSDKKSVTISGGGTISGSRLPGALALIGMAAGNISNINVTYTDSIVVTLTGDNQISAVITYSADGNYTGSKGPDSFDNSATVKYKGTKK